MGSYINLSSPLFTALHAGNVSECVYVVVDCVEVLSEFETFGLCFFQIFFLYTLPLMNGNCK